MNTKKLSTLFAAALLVAGTGCDNTTEPTQPPGHGKGSQALGNNCMEMFPGITSCELGQANLAMNAEGIHVSGMNGDADGVASTFANGMSWAQNARITWPANNNGALQLSAMSEGNAVSTLAVSQDQGSGTYAVVPGFTGAPNGNSNYMVRVYNNGVYQDGRPNVQARAILLIDWRTGNYQWVWPWQLEWDFYQVRPNDDNGDELAGACAWRMRSPGETFTLTFDDGSEVVGDEVEFIEHIDGGSYPYNTFQGIRVQGNVGSYLITSEQSSD